MLTVTSEGLEFILSILIKDKWHQNAFTRTTHEHRKKYRIKSTSFSLKTPFSFKKQIFKYTYRRYSYVSTSLNR